MGSVLLSLLGFLNLLGLLSLLDLLSFLLLRFYRFRLLGAALIVPRVQDTGTTAI